MVRSVTPFVHITVPRWLNRKLVEERAKERGITYDEACAELFKEDDK
jgi:hypothetical protein